MPLDRVEGVVVMVVVLLGACQKFAHPASSGAAANNSLAHDPIFIAAPLLLFFRTLPPSGSRIQGYRLGARAVPLPEPAHRQALSLETRAGWNSLTAARG